MPRLNRPSRTSAVRLLDSLEPDILAALRAQAERDLARRTVFGSMVYFGMVVVVAWGAAYYRDHPRTVAVFGALVFLLGAARLGTALGMRGETGPALYRWGVPLRRFTELQLAAWGLFGWWTLELYGFQPVSLLVLMCTAAFSGGITSSLSVDLALARRGILLIMLPPTIWGAFQGTREGWVPVAFGSVYLVFLLLQVREHHDAYWTTSVSAARAAAAERDRLFRVAFETANVGMALVDGDGRFRRVNQRLCGQLGRGEDDLLAATLQSLVADPKRGMEWYEALQVGVVSRERDELFVNGGTDPQWYAVSLAAVGGDGPEGLRYYVAMIHNVTARKRAEAERNEMEARHLQSQRLESIGTLAGGIAHDFNNLLALMMGYAELAAEKLQRSPAAADLREIVSAGERAATLVDQLLAFSRRQMTQPEILNLNRIISERYELLRRSAGTHIQLDLSLDSDPQDVEVDAGQFERVLLNLVLNARDAMPEGGRVRISTRTVSGLNLGGGPASSGKSCVALTVADTGCGMDAETRARAFEPFFTTKKFGSGLGLASVYGIVKQSGGEVRVESRLGSGTSVEIMLPRAGNRGAPAPKRTGDIEPPRIQASAAVLVAEDEPGLRKLVETILVSAGYQVSSAADGAEAYRVFLQEPERFDVLLTDVVMPGMSGRRLADQVRQRRPCIRVVYMTSYTPAEVAEHEVADPNVTVLAKPFRAEELRNALERALADSNDPAGHPRPT